MALGMNNAPPGLGGYLLAQQNAREAQTNRLQQAQGLMGLQQAMEKQRLEKESGQRNEALRAAIAALPPEKRTRENVLPLLLQHGALKEALPMMEKVEQPRGQPIGSGGLLRPDGSIVAPAARPESARAQPIGSGGLRLPDGTIVPPAGGGRQEPLHPIVGPDGKPILAPRSQAVGKTPYTPSIAGAGAFSPEALRMTAEQYLTGDRQAIMGYARNATARIALQNEIQKVAKERGWNGADVAAQMADFAGIMSGSRTVGTRAAQIELASSEAEKMIDIVLERSKAFERTRFVPVNVALRAFETQTGQPEVKAFGAAINSLVNVYARAISPSGVPTVSDKEHAREMLAQADSQEQVQAVMDVMRQEMKAARAAPMDVRRSTRTAVTAGTTDSPSPATPTVESLLEKYK